MTDDQTVYVTRSILSVGIEMLTDEFDIKVWDGKLPPDKNRIIDELAEFEGDGLLC